MNGTVAKAELAEMLKAGKRNFRYMKIIDGDFRDADLENADFKGASLSYAKFNKANLKYANFEAANCYGVDFTEANCYRTNFKDANLSSAIMHAKDFYGATFTLECKSFEGVDILPGWWYGWIFYALLMKPPSTEARDRLVQALGVERYNLLKSQYARRVT